MSSYGKGSLKRNVQFVPGRKIFIVVEKKDEEVAANTIELFQVERSLVNQGGGIFCSAVLGHQTGEILRNKVKFLVKFYCMDSPLLATFWNDLYPYLLERVC